MKGPPRLFFGFAAGRIDAGGGSGVSSLARAILSRRFRTTPDLLAADLQVHSFNWEAPRRPRRLFIDHGSFADAAFWAFAAPKLDRADVVVVSSSVCTDVAGAMFASGPRILRVPFTVDLARFSPEADRRSLRVELAGRLGVPADGPWLLVAAHLTRRKNHHLAILLHRAILERIPGARLLVCGATPDTPSSRAYREAVRSLAATSGDRVHWLGALSRADLAAAMAASSFLVHLSNCRLENFGLIVAEAMSAGLPVAAADWGGFRDLVDSPVTGFLAPTWLSDEGPRTDWMSLVDPIVSVLEDASSWNAMSRASRARASRMFSTQRFEDGIVQTVEQALVPDYGDGPVVLTEAAEELRFRVLNLHATHPEIRDAGDEFRLLMRLDGGSHYRLLAGAAATHARPVLPDPTARLRAVVPWRIEDGRIEVTDPAWPRAWPLTDADAALLRRCDGSRTLLEVLETVPAPPTRAEMLESAHHLVERGILCVAQSVRDGRESGAR